MKLINDDCILAMREMPDNSVDSIVTDPPYELGFMGKSWDSSGIAFNVEVWQEALRVLKPGGHLLAFSGSRTYHRMAVAIEDAGFEIRDQIMWVYGSGFPKSHNVSKGIDKSFGLMKHEGHGIVPVGSPTMSMYPSIPPSEYVSPDPISAEAQQWQGWGTALKPAHEPIVLARKPLVGTVASNVLTYGTGGLNIDGTRVGTDDTRREIGEGKGWTIDTSNAITKAGLYGSASGRFPANFIHDGSDEVNDLLGEPARFFYCAKASKRDRNEGLEGFAPSRNAPTPLRDGGRESLPRANHHPTVKPTDLMRYLVRLITPPNGIVLDPFMGSGSTGKACAYEGFNFIGIEQSAEYVEIAKARIAFIEKHPEQVIFPKDFERDELVFDFTEEEGELA